MQRNVGKLQLTFVTGMWRKSKRFVTANFGGIFSEGEREREGGERGEREKLRYYNINFNWVCSEGVLW